MMMINYWQFLPCFFLHIYSILMNGCDDYGDCESSLMIMILTDGVGDNDNDDYGGKAVQM